MGTPGERSLSTPNPTYRTDNRNHVGRPSDLAHAQVYPQAEEEPLEGVPRYGQDQGCVQGQEEIRVCWLLALRWLHDGRGWRIWQTVLWLSWLVCLHDLVRKRYQHGVHHAMGVTHRSYQRLFAQASWVTNLEMTSYF